MISLFTALLCLLSFVPLRVRLEEMPAGKEAASLRAVLSNDDGRDVRYRLEAQVKLKYGWQPVYGIIPQPGMKTEYVRVITPSLSTTHLLQKASLDSVSY